MLSLAHNYLIGYEKEANEDHALIEAGARRSQGPLK
jgi:hypothetical protein